MPTLVLMRHAKSDWSADTSDLLRPIGARGRRQAAEAGEWLAGELPPIELAIVSPAVRARTTWELAAEAFSASPRTAVDERLWTTDQRDILAVIRGIPDGTGSALVVSHDPAISAAASRLAAEPLVSDEGAHASVERVGRPPSSSSRRSRPGPSSLMSSTRPTISLTVASSSTCSWRNQLSRGRESRSPSASAVR